MMTLASLAVVATVAWAYLNQIPKLRWTPVPAGALAALRQCPDNLYYRYNKGGYLLWFAPDRKVFMDQRQDPFPPALVLEHIEVEHGRKDYRDVFARHNIHCAYLPTVSPTAAQSHGPPAGRRSTVNRRGSSSETEMACLPARAT